MSKEQKLSEQIWKKSSEWIDQIGVVIGELASQLGVATEYVYTIYTKQVYYEGLVYSSAAAAGLLFLVLVNIVTWIVTRKNDEESKWIPRGIACVVLLMIGSIISFEVLVPNLLKVFNPEYYTIKAIVDQIGGMIK